MIYLFRLFACLTITTLLNGVATAAPAGGGESGDGRSGGERRAWWDFRRRADAPLVPGRLPRSSSRDDARAAEILGLTLARWTERLDGNHPRDRVYAAAAALVRALLSLETDAPFASDAAFYPHLPTEVNASANPTIARETLDQLGLSRMGLRAIEDARAGRWGRPLEAIIDLPTYAAALPRITRGLAIIEGLSPSPLTNEVRRQWRELRTKLEVVVNRADELAPTADRGGLLRASTVRDDAAAAGLVGVSLETWTALITGHQKFRVPLALPPFESGRGERAARALVARLFTDEDLGWPPAPQFYPAYAQHDDVQLRRLVRDAVLNSAGLVYRFREVGQGQSGLVPKRASDDLVLIDGRVLRALVRVRALNKTFLPMLIDDVLFEVRAEVVRMIEHLQPDLGYSNLPAIRALVEDHDGIVDEAFAYRVLAFDDPRVRALLREFWARGQLRFDPSFARPIPRRLRADVLKHGADYFAAFLEHELDEDVVMSEMRRRGVGRVHRMARARLTHLKTEFAALVKADCDQRLAGGPR